ncbi:hypothetical protein K432DRAFT_430905 [Lepidopterella palustris CBS 459.81]|uniref:Uncharacterized protein n=1 Tax=Lepidopterella palustris CBS 459.81 TaxID=1314670 RepID=A0A8E2J8I5_9PEZI|nr:hypothetical protein K432DRAFT_430905 [Lepidopterella palustris CBS 459.81]
MQLINKLSILFFAALATASNAHLHGRHHHLARRQYGNETGISGPKLTTSTVYSTQLVTVISCAPTITNCPADATKVVTSIIAISTTVCPVTEAEAVASSTPSTLAAPVQSVITKVTNSTLTYTLGSGSSTTVVTTTIQHTSTETLYKTVYMTKSSGGGAGGYGASSAAAVALTSPTSTTTISSTSTFTKIITVYPQPSGSGSVVAAAATTNAGCAAPVTVTVTAMETVTVTEADTATGAVFSSYVPSSVVVAAVASSTPLYSSAPYGNGTTPSAASKVQPSGFLTLKYHHHGTGSALPKYKPTGYAYGGGY